MNRFTYLVKSKHHPHNQKSMAKIKKSRVAEGFWRHAQGICLKIVQFVSVKSVKSPLFFMKQLYIYYRAEYNNTEKKRLTR